MMAKKRRNMICPSECEECEYSNIRGEKNNLKIYCEAKEKTYFYGQYVPCDLKKKRKDINNAI